MNTYLHELKAYRRSTFIWMAALSLMAVLFLSLFPAFYKDARIITDMFAGFSQLIRDAFGFTPEFITSILGFYSFAIIYIVLCGAIQAMNIGTSLISKETAGKTVDFLLTKPVTRTRILTSKLLAALTCILVTNLVYLAVASVTAWTVQVKAFDHGLFMMLSLSLFYVQLIFLGIGFLISVLLRRIKSVLPVTLSTVFGFFFVSMFSSAIKDVQLRFLTPFQYFEPTFILNNSAYELTYVLLGILIVVVTILATYIIFQRKDIHAV
ncbi:MAG: ABC transporter permease subunit [Anaerolineae bacterium]